MSRRIDLLRLDYAFSVLVPCLMAIYINNLPILHHLDLLTGFLLYAVTGNTLNDVIDMRDPDEIETLKRVKGYHWKEILAIAAISFLFGTTMFVRTFQEHPINILYLTLTVGMVILYCFKKDVPILNQILLGASHVFFPYIMIKTDANMPSFSSEEWILMVTFFFYAFSGQVVHEIIDGDAITKFSPRTQQFTVILSSIITIIMGFLTVWLLDDIYFIPIALIPLGSIYTFRKPTESTQGVKDVGIVLGNVLLVYFFVLILTQGY